MTALISHMFRLALQCTRALQCPCHRSYGTVLYMTGDKAKDNFSVITPHIDIEDRFKDISVLQQSIELRGMQIDVDKIKSIWDILKSVEADKIKLEKRRIDIANQIKELKTDSSDPTKEMEKLKLQGKLLREDLKTTMKAVWELEKKVITRILSLPNYVHADTPKDGVKVVGQFGNEPSKQQTKSHVEIGDKLDILEYFSPMRYYLKGEGALYELCILNYFTEELCNHDFIRFCNSDFSRSVVVEGTGLDHEDPNTTFILKDTGDILHANDPNRLHLVGGASLVSFCTFHAKQIIPGSALPLRLVAMGRRYKPYMKNKHGNSSGLFQACQASSVEFFISTENNINKMMDEFDRTMELITDIYKKLGYPFRVVFVPAKSLKTYESLRASFQMYSSHLQSYVETGHISVCDDYISKRLLIRYSTESEQKFTRIICGTVVSVPKLLGCVLELYHDTNNFSNIPIPDEVKQHSF